MGLKTRKKQTEVKKKQMKNCCEQKKTLEVNVFAEVKTIHIDCDKDKNKSKANRKSVKK